MQGVSNEALIKQACIDKNTCPSESYSWVANGGLCSSVNSKKECMKCWIEALKGRLHE